MNQDTRGEWRRKAWPSAVFFILIPLLLVTFFYLALVNVVIAQYGTRLFENLMERQVEEIDRVSDYYLEALQEGQLPIQDFKERLENIDLDFIDFKILILKREGERESILFCFPESLIRNRISSFPFRGYCQVDRMMHHGVFKARGRYSILILFPLTDKYLEQISRLNEFTVEFGEQPAQSRPRPRDGARGIPWEFSYRYLDFDQLEAGHPTMKSRYFHLYVNLKEIFKALFASRGLYSHQFASEFFFLLLVIFGVMMAGSFGIGFLVLRRISSRVAPGPTGETAGLSPISSGHRDRNEGEGDFNRSVQLSFSPPDSFAGGRIVLSAANVSRGAASRIFYDYQEGDRTLTAVLMEIGTGGMPTVPAQAYLRGLMNRNQEGSGLREMVETLRNFSLDHPFEQIVPPSIGVFRWSTGNPGKAEHAVLGPLGALHFSAGSQKTREFHWDDGRISRGSWPDDQGDILMLFTPGLLEIQNRKERILTFPKLGRILRDNRQGDADRIRQGILDFILGFADNISSWNDFGFIIVKMI